MEIAGYIASVLIGISLGLIGGGGSILTMPVLVYLFNVSPALATSYSLFVVGSSSLVMGIVAIGQAIATKEWILGLAGGFLLYMALANIGCCGVNGCAVPSPKVSRKPADPRNRPMIRASGDIDDKNSDGGNDHGSVTNVTDKEKFKQEHCIKFIIR